MPFLLYLWLMKQKLPIGIQSFGKIREDKLLYIDKTEVIYRLIDDGSYYFLARPRRFGKSLTLSTIKELFLGRKDLFEGLWIENRWNWEEIYPVIHIGFSSLGYKDIGLVNAIVGELTRIAKDYGLTLTEKGPALLFRELIHKLRASFGKVVILIDEYDKPIIDYLDELPQAKANQKILKTFYSVIKDSDPYLRFLLITGVSKFSKVSVFSELNNLKDLTLHPKYSTLVGCTQAELEHYFEEDLNEFTGVLAETREELLQLIKKWYNGYTWDGKNFLYNPFSLLSFFDTGQFHNFWFSTGTPTFLIQLLTSVNVYDLERTEVGMVAFDSYDIENIDPYALLFQTGYLAIKAVEPFGLYVLDYPNREVKDSMLQYLMAGFSHGSYSKSTPIVLHLRKAFLQNDEAQIIKIINSLFKSIPSQIFIKDKEAYYHSVIYLVFQYLGLFIDAEVNTSDGRIDAVVQTDEIIYLLEFKLDESAEAALKQIRDKAYGDKYKGLAKKITALGINFSSQTKSIESWQRADF